MIWYDEQSFDSRYPTPGRCRITNKTKLLSLTENSWCLPFYRTTAYLGLPLGRPAKLEAAIGGKQWLAWLHNLAPVLPLQLARLLTSYMLQGAIQQTTTTRPMAYCSSSVGWPDDQTEWTAICTGSGASAPFTEDWTSRTWCNPPQQSNGKAPGFPVASETSSLFKSVQVQWNKSLSAWQSWKLKAHLWLRGWHHSHDSQPQFMALLERIESTNRNGLGQPLVIFQLPTDWKIKQP